MSSDVSYNPLELGSQLETPSTPNESHSNSRNSARHKACDNCKKRKVRCSGEEPCLQCRRSTTLCQYTSSHARLNELERRVNRYQKRIRSIETAWQRFVPGIELSVACDLIEKENDNDNTGIDFTVHRTVMTSNVSETVQLPMPVRPNNLVTSPVKNVLELDGMGPMPSAEQDLELERADALEWDESTDFIWGADGIGSLSLNQDQTGTGYMGPMSGNALLRKLQTTMMLVRSTADTPATQISPEPSLPDHFIQAASFRNKCVDCYFQHFNVAYPLLHEGYFRAQSSGAIPKPKDGSWPVLFNIVLAIGAFSSDMSNQNTDVHFYREAFRHLSPSHLQRGSLSLVQTISLMANYLQKRNKPNSGFTFLGIAMNMAQGIGLHREFSPTSMSAFTMEMRRRVWWTLFIFDSGARLTFGRPALSLAGISIELPRNLDDQDLSVDLDVLPPSKNHPTITSSLIWQSGLARLSNIANRCLLATRVPELSTMLELENDIFRWRDSMPPYLQAEYDNAEHEAFSVPRMVLLWRSMHLRVIVHRPFLLDLITQRQPLNLSDVNSGPRRCLDAARECVISIADFWNPTRTPPGALVWYTFYWLVIATFIPVTCILYEPQSSEAVGWRQLVGRSRTILDSLALFDSSAARAAKIIDAIMSLVPTTPDSTGYALNEDMRLECAEIWNQSWTDIIFPQNFSAFDQLL